MSVVWPAVERAMGRLRHAIRSTAPVDSWHDELLGDARLRQLEQRQERIAALIRDVDDEIRAILAEQTHHD